MREKIIEQLKKIELDYDVKVCFAVESGSRVWGFPSTDSDYDVRFIYLHKKEWYLSIDPKRDVIELPISNLLDINGWELRKALRLLKKSNPHLLEWLHSWIVYYQAFSLVEKLKSIQEKVFSPQSALYHYLNMAKGNNRDYLQDDYVKIKKYFYVLRPILACKWIEKEKTFPPIEFEVLVEKVLEPGPLKKEILTLMERKIAGEEWSKGQRIGIIHTFIETELERIQEYAKTVDSQKTDFTPQLDAIFRETLDEVWT